MTELPGARDIFLDGVRLPLAGEDPRTQFSDLVRFQPKMLFGDPSKDDNDLLSSWQFSDQSGGHGILRLKEGTDAGRFSISTLSTRFPGQLTKPGVVNAQSSAGIAGTGDKRILGEMWSDTLNEFLVIWTAGLNVRRGWINGGNLTALGGLTTSSGNLTNPAYNKGVSFQGTAAEEFFFIPQGNSGYATIKDTSLVPTEFAAPKFAAFANFDNKLVGISTGGRLYKTVDGTTWVAYDLTFALSKSYSYRGIISFFDRGDEPTLFILTGRDIWQFDPAGPELFRLDFGWPSHPDHARAYCVWNSQLYIAVGMGVFRYTGGAFMPVGLDRDDGLPTEYQGRITDLIPGYNAMYAVVEGKGGDVEYGSKSSIHEFTGSSWHTVWTQDTAVPSSIQYHGALGATKFSMGDGTITQSGGEYNMVWGTGGSDDTVYIMPLSVSFANPRAGIRAGSTFASGMYYYHETGEFNADMEGYIKIGNAIQLNVEEPYTLGLTDANRDTIRVLGRFDRNPWVEIGSQLANQGRYVLPLGSAFTVDNPAPGSDYTMYTGKAFEIAQLRFEVLRASVYIANRPMMITNMAMSFLKTVESNDAFTFTIDCSKGNGDMGPQELMDWIDHLTSVKRFMTLTVGPYTYRVYVSQNGGDRYSGDTQAGIRPLSVVEIPLSLGSDAA